MKEEIWKSLKGLIECGEYYEVSNLGNVRSIDREIKRKNGSILPVKGKILNPKKDTRGYLLIGLSLNGKRKICGVHRLVAMAFIPNPNNYPQVNHKDECITNNSVSNLEWCDAIYNNNYGTRNERMRKSKSKIVIAYKLETMEFVGIFKNTRDAGEKLNVDYSAVSKVCRGEYKHVKGYYFRYVNRGENNEMEEKNI